ncbi:MAG TPA: DUF190 domain-containing protein [Balneolales bacterium]|nr:DUF190 domain-containing protein [Balneolales bacterium]
METNSKLLRIFVGELDKIGHKPLYEEIVFEAKRQKMAGATVTQGVMSYGANSLIHRAKLVDISEDLPIVIEIVDTEDKIDKFLVSVNDLLEKSGSGGIITIEKATVIHYKPHKEK